MREIRYAVRSLLARPGFTAVVVVVLALGIGSTTAIFSIVDALLLKSLPYPESERLVMLREVNARGILISVTEPNFNDVVAQSQTLESVSIAAGSFPLVVTGGSEATRSRISYASGNFFKTMGVAPMLGRSFVAEEEKFGGPVAAIVSYGYWQKQLGGRKDIESLKLNIDGVSTNVVGVMPASFDYPAKTDIWTTRNTEPANTSRTAHNWPVVARIKSGTSIEQAQAEVSLIGKQLKQTYGAKMDAVDFALVPLHSHLTQNVSQGLWLLMGAVALLLLVTCANFSNLLLAHLTTRHREFVVRCALGASRLRITRQLIVENLLLTIPAALLGTWLASFGVKLLLLLDNGTLPQFNAIGVDYRVLLFACGLGVFIAVALSLLPAVRLSGHDFNSEMRAAGRGQVNTGLGYRLRSLMVVGQVALTLILLAGAGLLARSFINVMNVDPGFVADSSVAMTLSLPSTISPEEDERLRQFYVQLLERASQLPGVTAAGGINVLPLASRGSNGQFLIGNDPNQKGYADYRIASGGYFAAMKIPVLRGRVFDSTDTVNSPHVAVISQSLAQRYWPNGDALGKQIQFGNMDTDERLLNVVGIVGDVRDSLLEREPEPTIYAFSLQRPQWWQVSRLSIVVRGQTDAATLVPALRGIVQSLRSDAPASFTTLDQVFSSAFDTRRFSLVLFSIFGVVALLITSVGLYGMLAYSVAERRHEIGVRMALGAQAKNVLQLVIGQGLRMAFIGVVLGLGGAWGLTRLMKTLLYGVEPTDLRTFGGIAILLLVIAALACWLPARRATKVDPLEALRSD